MFATADIQEASSLHDCAISFGILVFLLPFVLCLVVFLHFHRVTVGISSPPLDCQRSPWRAEEQTEEGFPLTLGRGNAPKTGGMDRRDPRVVVKATRLRDDNMRNYHARLEAVRQQPCYQSYPSPGRYPDVGKLQALSRLKEQQISVTLILKSACS
jgi:hypothetical protein